MDEEYKKRLMCRICRFMGLKVFRDFKSGVFTVEHPRYPFKRRYRDVDEVLFGGGEHMPSLLDVLYTFNDIYRADQRRGIAAEDDRWISKFGMICGKTPAEVDVRLSILGK